jgi:hypothetical protein
MRRPALALVVAAAIALSAAQGSAAVPSGSPSFAASTDVHGLSVPPLVRQGPWRRLPHGWQTTFRSASPPAGSTSIHLRWRSPIFRLDRGERFFRTKVTVEQQGGPLSYISMSDTFRVCAAKRRWCTAWAPGRFPSPPNELDYLPFVARGEYGWGRSRWGAPTTRAFEQWRYDWVQQHASEAGATISVEL